MTPNQVKFYVKSGAEMLNWVTGTKTALDLNIMLAHTANIWALILGCQSHIFECSIVANLRRYLNIYNFMSEFKAKGPIDNVRVLQVTWRERFHMINPNG